MTKNITIAAIAVTIIVFLAIRFMSCLGNIELNTVNPQTSNSISDSKKNAFFIAEYKLAPADLRKGIILNDTWVEYVWKNTLKDGKRIKEKLSGIQLVMKTNSMVSLGFSDSTFLINWKIEVEDNQLPGSGSGNGAYINYLASKNPPDTIKVNVINTARGDTAIYKPISFSLIKQ